MKEDGRIGGLPARVKHKKPGALRQLTHGRLDLTQKAGSAYASLAGDHCEGSDAEVVPRPTSSSGRPCERRELDDRDRIYSSRSASVG
jgi:hypothetical protein